MNKRYGKISGWGIYAPENIVTNHDLEKHMETNHEWIVQRSGIHARHFSTKEETSASMAVAAGQQALDKANLEPNDLDFILVATTTPDYHAPSVANQVQYLIGARDVPAMTLNTGCTGFVYALSTAYQFIETGAYKNILVVGVEQLSKYVDWEHRSSAILFGDAAGAVVLQATDQECGLQSFVLGSDGEKGNYLMFPATPEEKPLRWGRDQIDHEYIHFNGREVFKFASRVLGKACQDVLVKAGMTLEEIDWIVPHQANLRIIQAAARDMNIPLERFIINIDRYANTSAASIPVALAEGLEDGRIQPDDTVLMVSFGAGLTWAATIFQLAPTGATPVGQTAKLEAAAAD